jgi:type I restriction-modification system DNA methylase subunit
MGRKERKRYDDNNKVREIINKKKQDITSEEVEFMKTAYTGIGGLTNSGFNSGQFFTPEVVTGFVVDMMGITGGRVLEPSCGGGAFIRALPEECDVVGCEYMVDTARVAEICNPNAHIINGDTLEMTFDQPFDHVIGNPPYGLKVDNWTFDCGSKSKSEVAFIEHGMRHLKDGGILGMVVPDSILANKREENFRKHIIENHCLLAVVSLPVETFYHVGTSVKTSFLMIKKGLPLEDDTVFMAMCEDIGWDRRGNPTNKCDLVPILFEWMDYSRSKTYQAFELVPSCGGIEGQLALAI